MRQIYPDQGLLYILDQIANGSGSGLYWQLYESNTIPTLAKVLADFTLAASSWGRTQVPVSAFTLKQVGANVGSIQAPDIVFINTTLVAHTVYGYVIIDPTQTKLIGAARFDTAPITIAVGGTQKVTPILGDYSQFPT